MIINIYTYWLNRNNKIYNLISMILYILLIVSLIILFVMGYIRVKFGFWALQPVFHVYNLSYMIWPPGIINHNLPEKNKYTKS